MVHCVIAAEVALGMYFSLHRVAHCRSSLLADYCNFSVRTLNPSGVNARRLARLSTVTSLGNPTISHSEKLAQMAINTQYAVGSSSFNTA